MTVLGMNMAPRANRRWLVAATCLSLLAVFAIVCAQGGDHAIILILLATIINGLILGGYGRGGLIKPFVTSRNDEREINRRDRMHFYAYRFVVALLLLGYVLGGAPFNYPQLSRALFLGGVVIGLTLPQALLLWMEPDVEAEEGE
jgi:MFS family permease